MLVVVRQRSFALLLVAGVISSVGDLVLSIALPFYVYDLTHSALQTGAMFIASTLPGLLVGSVAGVFVDRWDRKHTMVTADLFRVVLMLLLLAVRSRDALWIVYLVVFVEASVSKFFVPAKSAFIPRLVPAERLTAANSLDSVSSSIVNLIAPSLGGALLVLLGLSGVVLVDSASFLLYTADSGRASSETWSPKTEMVCPAQRVRKKLKRACALDRSRGGDDVMR